MSKLEKGVLLRMEIRLREEKRIVEIWLTQAEGQDTALQESLKGLYARYRAKKYAVAVFRSGRGNLFESTRDLLLYNRRRNAEQSVQQQKKNTP